MFCGEHDGNVVFLGFALAGVGEISVVASLLAVLAFVLGAAVGGRWAAGQAVRRYLWVSPASVQARRRSESGPSSRAPPVCEARLFGCC
jgi:uncharacterized membrane protein YoaK (UPF0700 family)